MKNYVIKQADLDKWPGLSHYGVKVGHVYASKPKNILSLEEIHKRKSAGILSCDPNQPGDAHFGEAGFYDGTCVWFPEVGG